MQIYRKKRFIEHTTMDQYSGIIMVSNKRIDNNPNKKFKINITQFFLLNNNFILLDKFIEPCNINKFVSKEYNIKSDSILFTDIIFKKNNKIIYLLYLHYDTQINNCIYNKQFDLYNNNPIDIYQNIIYNRKKCKQNTTCKLQMDKHNFLEIKIYNIFYYLIGNKYK